MKHKQALLIFQKNAEHGKVKTRLAQTTGNDEALRIYKLLTAHTHQAANNVAATKWLFYSSFYEADFESNRDYEIRVQRGDDLGQRMCNAFADVFASGYDAAVIIGTDCPGLTPAILREAFSALELYDLVAGPAADGGYYLLGMKRLYATLFSGKNWSTDTVLSDTLRDAQLLGLMAYQLPVLSDVDTEHDWIAHQHFIGRT
ncbi:MAG: TIGR04282 family arsenosugar biosynthesis glycosyltransferase [Bacteroidetes bacterium]|nr:TIGR04282 family arsenosugar biosynthesis glycosyltransferase [Bacteroidota bacterium]